MNENGYYQYPISFPYYKKKYQLSLKRQTPSYLSIDFWSGQSRTLRKEKLYVIRTGKGRFAIFSEDRFTRPYLDLKIDKTEELVPREIQGYRLLKAAFKDHYQEDVNLEHLRMTGIYDQLVSHVCGTDKYQIGPRGGRNSRFKLYFNDKENLTKQVILDYQGQEELDYSIWTEDSVLVFEAKQTKSGGLDIGWHKLALPCYRFRNYQDLKVIPVYYLRRGDTVYLFVFSPIDFQKDGIVLNDDTRFKRYQVFRVNLSASLDGIK